MYNVIRLTMKFASVKDILLSIAVIAFIMSSLSGNAEIQLIGNSEIKNDYLEKSINEEIDYLLNDPPSKIEYPASTYWWNALANNFESNDLKKLNHSSSENCIKLWNMQEIQLLELVWWRTKNRATRLIILSIYYTQVDDTDKANLPFFKEFSMRFNDGEKNLRLEEYEYVIKNKKRMKEKIDEVIKKFK